MNQPLRTVLCVDDERDILDVASMCLELVGGYQVSCCESGQAALDALDGGMRPDLILLDVMMPGMNGPETLAAVRQRSALDAVPIVFMTARVQESEVRAYLRLGVTAVIPKPFDPMKLPGELGMIWNAFNEVREAVVVENDVAERMMELRVRYVAALSDHIARLEEWRTRLARGELLVPERTELKGTAHRLAGTGKTYGFADVSEAARLIDDRLTHDIEAPDAELSALVGLLMAACLTAQAGGAGAAPRAAPANEGARSEPASGGPARQTFGKKTGTTQPVAVRKTKPTVLVADDDRMVRSLFSELLADDAHIVEAADSDEALKLMRLHRPALILLDDIMPGGVTGLKLLETLQASGEFAQTPIIMITASDSEADIRRGLMAGAAEYITKPFDGVRVVASIRARLDRLALKVG
jgi:two-component system OmpR family response regulator